MRKSYVYTVCTILLLLLVLSSFSAPGLLLQIQDARHMQSAEFGSRSGIDYEAVNARYLADRTARIGTLVEELQKGTPFYISAVEKDSEEIVYEKTEILKNMLEGISILWDLGIAGHLEKWFLADCELHCSEYLIYSSDTESGVVLPCLCIELTLQSEKLRIMADATDFFVYYMEYYGENVKILDKEYQSGKVALKLMGESGLLMEYYRYYLQMEEKETAGLLFSGFVNEEGEYGLCIGFREIRKLMPKMERY